MLKQAMRWMLLPAAAAVLVACGGGGGGSNAILLGGTVAVGSPLAGAVITARDASGRTSSSVLANEQGVYQNLDVTGLTAPFVIEAVGQLGQTPLKLSTPMATTAGVTNANVTTLTTTLSAILAGGDPSNLQIQNITTSGLTVAAQVLSTAIAPVMQTVGVSASDFNPITSAFVADSTGKDKLLDALDIRYRPNAVFLANRLQTVIEGQTDSDLSQVSISSNQATGALPAGTNRNLAGLRALSNQISACFRVPASQRATYTQDAFGLDIIQTVHAACRVFLHDNYMTNTYSWGQRWLPILKDPSFDNAVFEPQLRYVVAQPFANIASDVYVVNFNFRDIDGNGYTRPEVAILESGTYKLYGNQREMDAGVEPVITKLTDFTNPTSGAGNRVEGRIRFWLTPHRDWEGDDATGAYKFFYKTGSNKPDPVIPCVWVTGPDLPGNGARNSANSGPLGGILLKVPRSDYVARQDYLAVHVKFSDSFDPVGVAEDRRALLKACAAREWNGTSWEIATWSTNNQYTIDAAKSSSSSTFAWPTAAQLNLPFSWSPASAGYTANTYNGSSYAAMVGSRNGTYALNPVTQATKAAYFPTEMPVYTFYAFHRDSLNGLDYGRSVATAAEGGSDSTPITSGTAALTKANALLADATIVKARMVGAKPYLELDANGVYAGAAPFGSVDSATTFLAADAPTLPMSNSLALAWSVPTGATGTDRIGYSCWANWMNGTSKVRWGPSVSSNNWAVPRNIRSKVVALEEDCIGYNWGAGANAPTRSIFLTSAFTTVNGSGVVSVHDAAHNLQTGDSVTISGVSQLTVNGLPRAALARTHQVTRVDENTYSISLTDLATAGNRNLGANATVTRKEAIASRYREIWARTYDTENRAIQSVQFADR
jgi:hypothetical protein